MNLKQDEVLSLEPSLQIVLNRPALEGELNSVALAVQLAIESAIGDIHFKNSF